jgi:inosine/xanthosine triphosphatase
LKKVVIASLNPVKIACIRQAFVRVFPGETFEFQGVPAPSGVPEQPMNDRETLLGAINRAEYVRKHVPADYWAGIEGGIQPDGEDLEAFAWVVIQSQDKTGRARTATFMLPPEVAALVRSGMELGHADDLVFRQNNSKQGNGAVGILTGDIITRTTYYEHAAILALIPFMNPEMF